MDLKRTVALALASCSLLATSACGGGSNHGNPFVFAVSVDTLYRTELSGTGTDTAVGAIHLAGGTGVDVIDVAVAPDGTLYATGSDQLYQVDGTTALATPIGSNTLPYLQALAFDASGNLYGAGSKSSAYLYRIDAGTGAATIVGELGAGQDASGDM